MSVCVCSVKECALYRLQCGIGVHEPNLTAQPQMYLRRTLLLPSDSFYFSEQMTDGCPSSKLMFV